MSIQQLPTEILYFILKEVVDTTKVCWDDRGYIYPPLPTTGPKYHRALQSHIQPFVISQVCTRWRSLLLERVDLWGHVVVCYDHPVTAGLLSLWLDRIPPTFGLTWRIGDSNLKTTFPILLPMLERCRRLKVSVYLTKPVAFEMELDETFPIVPALESVDVQGVEIKGFPNTSTPLGEWLLGMVASAPRLHTARWGHSHTFFTKEVLIQRSKSLTRLLVTGHGDMPRLYLEDIIASLPALQVLHIQGYNSATTKHRAIMPAFELRSVRFAFVNNVCSDFLQFVRAPRLERLEMAVLQARHLSGDDLVDFLVRSKPPLQRLAIYCQSGFPLLEKSLIEVVVAPCLQGSLSDFYLNHSPASPVVNPTIRGPFVDVMTVTDIGAAVLPKLTSLHLGGYNVRWADGAFARMLESRKDKSDVAPITDFAWHLGKDDDNRVPADVAYVHERYGVGCTSVLQGKVLPDEQVFE